MEFSLSGGASKTGAESEKKLLNSREYLNLKSDLKTFSLANDPSNTDFWSTNLSTNVSPTIDLLATIFLTTVMYLFIYYSLFTVDHKRIVKHTN